VRISAKADYALRACVQLAAADGGAAQKGAVLAAAQRIPLGFLENILGELRSAGIVTARRGSDGGYRLARPAGEVTLADVVRAVDGPLAAVRGIRPTAADFPGAAQPLREVWVAVRSALRRVLDHVTVADVAAGRLPAVVHELLAEPGAWSDDPGWPPLVVGMADNPD